MAEIGGRGRRISRNSEPTRELVVPDFVITLMKPPLEPPNSAFAVATRRNPGRRRDWNVNAGRWPPRCSPKERIIEVGAVHRDVVVDAPLATDADLVAVRPLHNRHVGSDVV